MASPSIIIVGADKGGVGKTTVSRTLVDYLATKRVEPTVYDTESPKGDLVRFCRTAKVIDIGTIKGQMLVFDGAEAAGVTLVDLRAGMLSQTLQALDEARLLDDVRSGVLNLVLLHVLGPSVASIDEVASAAKRIGGGAKHLLVKNHINATEYDVAADDFWTHFQNMTVTVPPLEPAACEDVQKLGGGFGEYTLNTAKSRWLRGVVSTWLKKVWADFDRVKLDEMIGARPLPAADAQPV